MLTRLSEGGMRAHAEQTGGFWSAEAVGALEDLLRTIGPSVDIITSKGGGMYVCELSTCAMPAKRTRMASTPAPNGIYGDICKVFTIRQLDGTAFLTVNAYDPKEMLKSASIALGPRTFVEVYWSDGKRTYTSDDIAREVMPRLSGLPRWRESLTGNPMSWASAFDPSAPWSPAVTSALSSGVSTGIGGKTIEGGMIPPSVYVGPPAEPKTKKKWWKR